MTTRRNISSLLLISAFLLVLVLLWLWNHKRTVDSQNEANENQPPTNSVAPSAGAPASSSPQGASSAASSSAVDSISNKGTEIKTGLATLNDVPIVFYGKLQDQFGNPVVGANVVGDVLVYNGQGTGGEKITTTSDAGGLFQLRGGKGESLGVWPTKTGYAIATTGTEFKYSFMYPNHVTPDRNEPVIIKMWKLLGAQPLVQINERFKLPYTSAVLRFDLVTGSQVANGGDIAIAVSRPEGVISQQHPQNWNVRVEAVDGGFITTSEVEARVTYGAPADGYKPSDVFQNNNGPDLVDQMLFIKSRNGQIFSKVHALFRINGNPEGLMNISFKGVANTNASGNWEADPNATGAINP